MDCKYFEECSAPLCPLNGQSVEHGAWYPDEEICRRRNMPEWVLRQKKIARKTGYDSEAGFFTVGMLERKCILTSALKGADPDKGPAKDQEDVWLRKHPEHRASEKQLEHARNTLIPRGKSA